MDLYATIADERRASADLLGLSAERSATPSLCDARTVRGAGAHLLVPLVTSGPRFGHALLRDRNIDRASEKSSAQVAALSDAASVADSRDDADHRFTPPGLDLGVLRRLLGAA